METAKDSLTNIFSYYPKMLPILSFAVLDGVSSGYAASSMIHLFPEKYKNDQIVFAIYLSVSGVGTMIAGFFGGKVCDAYPLKKGGIMLIFWYILGCLVCYLTYFVGSIYLVYASAFFWGFQIVFEQSYVLVCCSKMYEGSKQSFAIVKQVHSLSFIIYEVISLATHN